MLWIESALFSPVQRVRVVDVGRRAGAVRVCFCLTRGTGLRFQGGVQVAFGNSITKKRAGRTINRTRHENERETRGASTRGGAVDGQGHVARLEVVYLGGRGRCSQVDGRKYTGRDPMQFVLHS